jgi:hypothetical protein
LIRPLFTVALVVLLTAALALGNCVRCTDLIPVQKQTHDCCDTEQAPASPSPEDCTGKTVDFAKAIQPDSAKSLVILAAAGPLASIRSASVQDEDTAVFIGQVDAHSPLLAAPLRI